eukprot:9933292-Lingulodinium_polyedra.AAC.1
MLIGKQRLSIRLALCLRKEQHPRHLGANGVQSMRATTKFLPAVSHRVIHGSRRSLPTRTEQRLALDDTADVA